MKCFCRLSERSAYYTDVVETAEEKISKRVEHEWVEFRDIKFIPYKNKGSLGKGGYGSISKVEFESGEILAKKTVTYDSTKIDRVSYLNYYDKDIYVLGKFPHPNIIKCYYKGISEDGEYELFIEMVENGSLAEFIRSKKAEFVENSVVRSVIKD